MWLIPWEMICWTNVEADIPDEDMVDTMGYGILESMERKNGNICYDSDSSCWEEHDMDDYTSSLYDILEKY